ncbi:hypothetical protein GCM10009718_24230 [Isoptericola halotolerans]|uniref:Lipoprotein n=1 Tax=Isoptericola halotolerans TaxID=300560 RepID=A0ABX2A7W8_9MICO|nr:hypothetical protein [Isoptericola halotolerans]NOV98013.1 hypothetical protein [Isoptericola halotolerans]
MRTKDAHIPGGAGLAAVAALTIAACGAGDGDETCFDWAVHDTPVQAAQDALVVRGAVVGAAGEGAAWGVRAARWDVAVDEVLAGEGVEAGQQVTVLSSPETCNGGRGPYPVGDPLDVDGEVVVLLHDDAELGFRTVTPFDGVVAVGPGGDLPARWPSDHRRP